MERLRIEKDAAALSARRHYEPVTSEPICIRSLYNKAQRITFTVEPLKT